MRFALYLDGINEWRWTLHAANGKILADGGEGYHRFPTMCRSLRSIFSDSPKRSAELEKAIAARNAKPGRQP